jgi:hypothetical protein
MTHKLVHKDLSAGVPSFERYITRAENLEKTSVLGMKASPVPYDLQKVKHGHHLTRPNESRDVVPFKLLGGRDNLY